MKTNLDRSGRVVIPQKLRKMADLAPGVEFEIDIRGREIVLKPIEVEPVLLKKDSVLIAQGEIVGDMISVADIRGKRHKGFLAQLQKGD